MEKEIHSILTSFIESQKCPIFNNFPIFLFAGDTRAHEPSDTRAHEPSLTAMHSLFLQQARNGI